MNLLNAKVNKGEGRGKKHRILKHASTARNCSLPPSPNNIPVPPLACSPTPPPLTARSPALADVGSSTTLQTWPPAIALVALLCLPVERHFFSHSLTSASGLHVPPAEREGRLGLQGSLLCISLKKNERPTILDSWSPKVTSDG